MACNSNKTSSAPTAPASIHGPYGVFHENGTLRIIIVILLMCDAMVRIFIFTLSSLLPTETQLESADQILKIFSITKWVQIAIIVPLVIFFCMWVNRCCKNGWLIDAPRMKTTPGLAVGYYFIPVLSLWKPFTTMKEIRNASYGRNDVLNTTLRLWWFFWLALLSITIIITLIHENAFSPETLSVAEKLHTVASPIRIILAYLAISLVIGITRAQNQRISQWRT